MLISHPPDTLDLENCPPSIGCSLEDNIHDKPKVMVHVIKRMLIVFQCPSGVLLMNYHAKVKYLIQNTCAND
jgi:hypothetical protein